MLTLFILLPTLITAFLLLLVINVIFMIFRKDKNSKKGFSLQFLIRHLLCVMVMLLILLLLKLAVLGYC